MDNNSIEKIKHEISRINKLLSDAKPLLDLCKIKEPDFVEITACAQILHSFYNGVESIVVLIYKNLNVKLPNDIHWHKTLFEISFGSENENTKIFSDEIKGKLSKYLLFRHFVRHSYSSELEWGEMDYMIKNIEEIWEIIKKDFDDYMNKN